MRLFSLLDVILELPMDDLIKQISIPQNVTAALCEHKGELFDILTLSLCYEKLNWEETAKICNTLNISEFTVIETMQAAQNGRTSSPSVKDIYHKTNQSYTSFF